MENFDEIFIEPVRLYHVKTSSLPFRVTAILILSLNLVACGDSQSPAPATTINIPPVAPGPEGSQFTIIPLELTDFVSLVPLGNLNPSGHVFPTDHHYFALTHPGTTVPVKAPGNITIETVKQMEHLTDGFVDYSIAFRLSDDVTGEFGHLSSLIQSIMDQVGEIPLGQTYSTGGKEYRYSSKAVSIEILAGTVIGTAGENPDMLALDFGVYDSQASPAFANPTRIESMGQYFNAVSCLDYFSTETSAILQTRCGTWDGQLFRTVIPIGGTVNQDIAGSAQGIWFLAGTSNYPQDPHISFVHDNVTPSIPVISVGTSIPGLQSGTYSYPIEASGDTNRDFGDIVPDGNIYAFHSFTNGENGTILVNLIDENSLKIERVAPGTTAPWAFTGNAVTFER